MGLSSEDVVNWDLKTGMRGYLVPQVDELLDEVADELDRLGMRIRELESEREAVRNSLDEQFEVEETLRRTLYQAQKAADQTLADASAEAERLRSEAVAEAERIRTSARENAEQILEDARHEASEDRAEIRSRLESQETRLRATGSQLRRDLVALHQLAVETQQMLRGLHEDRLRELDRGLAQLPDFDDDQWLAKGFEEATPAVEPSVAEASPAEPAAESSAASAGESSVEETSEASAPDVDEDAADDDATTDPSDGRAASEVSAEDSEEPAKPAYLAAVSEAIATIEENQHEDADTRDLGTQAESSPDDLLDSVLADDPGMAHQDLAEAVSAKPDDLFGDRPAPRRRRST